MPIEMYAVLITCFNGRGTTGLEPRTGRNSTTCSLMIRSPNRPESLPVLALNTCDSTDKGQGGMFAMPHLKYFRLSATRDMIALITMILFKRTNDDLRSSQPFFIQIFF